MENKNTGCQGAGGLGSLRPHTFQVGQQAENRVVTCEWLCSENSVSPNSVLGRRWVWVNGVGQVTQHWMEMTCSYGNFSEPWHHPMIFYQIGNKGGPKEAVVMSILESAGAKGHLYCPYPPLQADTRGKKLVFVLLPSL